MMQIPIIPRRRLAATTRRPVSTKVQIIGAISTAAVTVWAVVFMINLVTASASTDLGELAPSSIAAQAPTSA